ncbi:unnamed protein product [Pseudo-nitzschia multistriata]|uniref:Uncharacterized protein n=1 Tax=Pseudo-nitzschia multistriata TaxID=183589 RepID=A0A448Z2F1_9STRA|nr:unnamed protein product [Pseudo-nitzschia multistriata]VEU45352.1 unnamed protein product [Pseudo-nitzschia multistriata]
MHTTMDMITESAITITDMDTTMEKKRNTSTGMIMESAITTTVMDTTTEKKKNTTTESVSTNTGMDMTMEKKNPRNTDTITGTTTEKKSVGDTITEAMSTAMITSPNHRKRVAMIIAMDMDSTYSFNQGLLFF